MILARAPLRISFFGGGTDLPSFYQIEPGAVLSAAINKYVWVAANDKFDKRVRVSYSCTENVPVITKIQNEIIRQTLEISKMDFENGLEIATIADVPSKGTGLGSSSALAVALTHAIISREETQNGNATKHFLARRACEIEICRCHKPIGKQDQYAAAFGGMNLIRFYPNEEVEVIPLLNSRPCERLLKHLVLMYVGERKIDGDTILSDWAEIPGDKMSSYRRLADLAEAAYADLEGDRLSSFGDYLAEAWEIKRSLSHKISNPHIDAIYTKAQKLGAKSGKLLGAGSGGFFLFYVPPENRARLIVGLMELGLKHLEFGFDFEGSKVVYNG